METAVFGGGCFWCTEAIFQSLKGVDKVTPGYAGGEKTNPSYEEVCSGTTGHAEVVKVEFNPREITFEDLLEVFFNLHNPTTKDQQGADMGTQYRSIILYTSSQQKEVAENYIQKITKENKFSNPIVTELKPITEFYPAESYHQDYFTVHQGAPYCEVVISPKLEKLKEKFSKLVK